jgi:hypothetical protein
MNETDLMTLAGWGSRPMVSRYGGTRLGPGDMP